MNKDLINNPKEIKKFGIVLGIILAAIGALQWYHHHPRAALILWSLATIAELLALFVPMTLRPVMIGFLKVAHVIGWINTRILLTIIFYLVFFPIGLLIKLFGKDLLHKKIDKSADTYWVDHEVKALGKKHYEKQF